MNDIKELINYRLQQADETLADARILLEQGGSFRTIVNRCYYVTFYAMLALFIHDNVIVRTSKHAGIITMFNKEFIHSGKLPLSASKAVQRLFDARQESDYKEFAIFSETDVKKFLAMAEDFLSTSHTYTDRAR